MMQSCISRRCDDCRTQYVFSLAVAAELAIQIGKVYRCGRKLWTESKRRLEFGLRICRLAAAHIEISERRVRFRAIGIKTLRGDELVRCAIEAFAVGNRLACSGHRGEQRDRADAHAAAGVGKKRRDEWPGL